MNSHPVRTLPVSASTRVDRKTGGARLLLLPGRPAFFHSHPAPAASGTQKPERLAALQAVVGHPEGQAHV